MSTDTSPIYAPSAHYMIFREGIDKITSQVENANEFHLSLYYASMVSMMEKYLHDIFIAEVECNEDAFWRMCKMNKFQDMKFSIFQALKGNVKNHAINSVKSMVWHRLNDVELFFKTVFDFKFNISSRLVKIVAVRHDIVHRNGFSIVGEAIHIDAEQVSSSINILDDFIRDIDKKHYAYKARTEAS